MTTTFNIVKRAPPLLKWHLDDFSQKMCNMSTVAVPAESSRLAPSSLPPAHSVVSGSSGPFPPACWSNVGHQKSDLKGVCVGSLHWGADLTHWAWSSWSWVAELVNASAVSFCLSCSISACKAANCCSRACETKTDSDKSPNKDNTEEQCEERVFWNLPNCLYWYKERAAPQLSSLWPSCCLVLPVDFPPPFSALFPFLGSFEAQ